MPIMRYGFYIDKNGHIVVNKNQTAEGFQKGLKTIILERGLWRDGMKKYDALYLLLQKDDLIQPNSVHFLDETVKSLGAWLNFVSKYYPVFNCIDMYWVYSSKKFRIKCDYEWESLLVRVPEALDSVLLLFMRRAYKKCCRYIDS